VLLDAKLEPTDLVLDGLGAGEEDERDLVPFRPLLQALTQAEPVELRHPGVGDDEIRVRGVDLLQRVDAVHRGRDVEAGLLQGDLEDAKALHIAVNEEQALLRHGLYPRADVTICRRKPLSFRATWRRPWTRPSAPRRGLSASTSTTRSPPDSAATSTSSSSGTAASISRRCAIPRASSRGTSSIRSRHCRTSPRPPAPSSTSAAAPGFPARSSPSPARPSRSRSSSPSTRRPRSSRRSGASFRSPTSPWRSRAPRPRPPAPTSPSRAQPGTSA